MKHDVLLISNTNLFTVLGFSFLSPWVHAHTLNVRYTNEELDRHGIFVQQIKEARLNYLYETGVTNDSHVFVFDDRMIHRLQRAKQDIQPRLIIIEMRNFKEQERFLLHYATKTFNVPVVVFSSAIKRQERISAFLEDLGVRDLITTYNKDAFENVIRRNLLI